MANIAVWKLEFPEQQNVLLERISLERPVLSLNEASRLLPNGVYTTFRTYEGTKILPLEDHIRRLEESAGLLGSPIRLDRRQIQNALQMAVHEPGEGDARIRLTVDLEVKPGRMYISLEALETPAPEAYRDGVYVITFPIQRTDPLSKHTRFISIAESIRESLPPGAHEGLLLDEAGRILEGLSSNFFAVKRGELWTPGDGILPGITRSLILEAARQENIPVRFENLTVDEIPAVDEAFLTSSTRSVLPIRRIDDFIIGDGKPGPITKSLSRAYWDKIRVKLIPVNAL